MLLGYVLCFPLRLSACLGDVTLGAPDTKSKRGPPTFLSFACPFLEPVRASGIVFVLSAASVGVPWACDVGGVGYREHKRFPAQDNAPGILSFVCPIVEGVRASGVCLGFSVACVRVPWASALGESDTGSTRGIPFMAICPGFYLLSGFVFSVASVGVPWACDVGVLGCFPAQGNSSRFLFASRDVLGGPFLIRVRGAMLSMTSLTFWFSVHVVDWCEPRSFHISEVAIPIKYSRHLACTSTKRILESRVRLVGVSKLS